MKKRERNKVTNVCLPSADDMRAQGNSYEQLKKHAQKRSNGPMKRDSSASQVFKYNNSKLLSICVCA